MSERLERTMELQKFVADNADNPDAIVARLERAEHESFVWWALKTAGGMTPETVGAVERSADILWNAGLRRTP